MSDWFRSIAHFLTCVDAYLHDPEMTDEQCLKVAQSIRTILVTL
jgi:hypothetical protein